MSYTTQPAMLRISKYMSFTYLFKCLYFRMFRFLLGRVPVVVHVP
jgi:hypothetical protein